MADPKYPSWKFLAGFVGETDSWTYLSGQGIQLTPDEERDAKASIKRAVDYVTSLPPRGELSPRIRPLPSEHRDHISQLEAEPTFSEIRQGAVSVEWGLVEIGNVRCFQQNINSGYVAELTTRLPKPSDSAGTIRFCQPLSSERQKIALPIGFNQSTNTYTIVSENLDLRIQGNIGGQTADPNGVQRSFVGFMFGFGLPQIAVAEYRGKFVIRNGYHRALALLQAGHTEIPAVVVHCSSYQATGGAAPGFLPPDLVLSDRPPVLADYLSDAAVEVQRRRMRVIISVHGETQVIGA